MPLDITPNSLSAEYVRTRLDYERDTGHFRWRPVPAFTKQWNAKHAGKIAGGPASYGYWRIIIDHRGYLAHRIAWLWVTGELPTADIDHRNGVRDDNRWENLRCATRGENAQNICTPKHNTSGLIGAFRNHKRWMSQIQVDGVLRYLGTYDTPEEAHAAYLEAKQRLHDFQPVPREMAGGAQ